MHAIAYGWLWLAVAVQQSDKQPWTYGEPYTSINRASLERKMRLSPYLVGG
jgi:alpha-glucosidase (family GH31 glycosyl hydrolase)